jgi:transient receptor potential cation channel subfamily C protein 4
MDATFKTVFWSLFGLAEKEGVKLENYDKHFTEIVGYLIYGAFNIACVIVLLNMLIAMMSKSYETIEEHADVEWKFARSKLYMEYIKEGRILTNIKQCRCTKNPFLLPVYSLYRYSIHFD